MISRLLDRRGFLGASLTATIAGVCTEQRHDSSLAYLGDYTTDGGPGLRLAQVRGDTVTPFATVQITNPSWLVRHGSVLYAVNESTPTGGVCALSLADHGHPRMLNEQSSEGDSPTHCCVHKGHVVSSNYGSGSLVVHPIADDGSLLPASDLVEHGPGAHAHQCIPDPTGRWLLAVDIGLDVIVVYRLQDGKLREHRRITLSEGSGPRHMSFHPGGRVGYLVHEYRSIVTVFDWNGETGDMTIGQSVGTRALDAEGENYPAEVVVSDRGDAVYVCNRGDDTVTWFETHDHGRGLIAQATVAVGGVWPRHLALHENFLYAANQRSGTLTWLPVDARTGSIGAASGSVELPAASMILFA